MTGKLPRIPAIQVALDFIRLEDALRVAQQVVVSDRIILEVGTPLIKSEGIRSVSILRSLFPETPILADMKTMDTGYLEAQLAFDAGADIVSVLGAADNTTIAGALRKAIEANKLVQVDMISVNDVVSRALEVKSLGAHIIGVHAGIDMQTGRKLRAVDLSGVLRDLKNVIGENTLISIAGGVKPDEVGELVSAGADIVVIGAAITRSSDPRREILEALRSLEATHSDQYKKKHSRT